MTGQKKTVARITGHTRPMTVESQTQSAFDARLDQDEFGGSGPFTAEELTTESGKTKIFSRGVAEKDREERKRTPIQTPADRPRTPRKAGDRVS